MTSRSPAASGPDGFRRFSAANRTRTLILVRRRDASGAEHIEVRLSTRSWCRAAMTWPIIPPRDTPTMCAAGQSSASSTDSPSVAMSATV
ncbi:MAG TPA: hypothetical protein VGG05_22390 [Pseudonocardiaceae bacterium]